MWWWKQRSKSETGESLDDATLLPLKMKERLWSKKCRQLLEAGKGKETESASEISEGTSPPNTLISGLLTSKTVRECELFKATRIVVVCHNSKRKLAPWGTLSKGVQRRFPCSLHPWQQWAASFKWGPSHPHLDTSELAFPPSTFRVDYTSPHFQFFIPNNIYIYIFFWQNLIFFYLFIGV